MESWFAQRNWAVSSTQLYEGAPLPRIDEFDWLVVLGGPMSVNDESTLPWLVAEKEFVGEAIRCGKVVLGVCLGAQLIAAAMGATVYANADREIGWFPINRTDEGTRCGLHRAIPAAIEAFHWHGETFDLPPGTVHLARSGVCENQAFSYGDRVLGFQFHLETTEAAARALVENCASELGEGQFVQEPDAMLARQDRFENINKAMCETLDYLESLPTGG